MRRCCAVLVVVLSACAHPKPPPPADVHTARLAAADAQVRAGCLDCLVAAYREYDALRAVPAAADQAAAGTVRAAALIALRERELGMVDEGYLQRAREAAAAHANVPIMLVKVLDIIDALPAASVGAGRPTSDVDLEKMRGVRANRDAWTDVLRTSARLDEAAASTWLAFMCNSSDARTVSREDVLAPVSTFADTALIRYRTATCRAFQDDVLQSLLAADARFREIDYSRGVSLVAKHKLDDADALFARVHEWHPAWPTLTLALANVAMTAEEFDRGLAMYEETLHYEPQAVDALLGKIRALTYLDRHVEAIATTDELLAQRWYVGDARYWRALNETELERYEDAWTDIELAAKLLLNAEVPKLAGIIAYRRHELEVSRGRFELSRTRNPHDCETGFYLGLVLAEVREWPRTAEVMSDTARCLQNAEDETKREIEEIRASTEPEPRKARKIVRREQQIANARRMRATSWFNTAVAYYNVSRPADAREYAEKVVDDQQFGERARELIARLNK